MALSYVLYGVKPALGTRKSRSLNLFSEGNYLKVRQLLPTIVQDNYFQDVYMKPPTSVWLVAQLDNTWTTAFV